MSDDNKKDPHRHWLKPLKGDWRGGNHLLLWVEETGTAKRAAALIVSAIHKQLHADGSYDVHNWVVGDTHDLDEILDMATKIKGTLTIWLAGGWDHLVLSGLAEMIDQNIITFRYCAIDTHRVLIRGLWRSRPIIITSLANWTGGTWDSWKGKANKSRVGLFFASWEACLELSRQLECGSLAPSAGAAGLLFWRSKLGPVLTQMNAPPVKGAPAPIEKGARYIAPIPSRPKGARMAERQCAYGLTHRQMRRGLVEGPIYCCDLSGAYLLSLLTTPTPVMFSKYLYRPKLEELLDYLGEHTGCALVQLRSLDDPYPVRRQGRILWATGEYWTWLAGTELANAACQSQITACEAAYLWASSRYHEKQARPLLQLQDVLIDKGQPLTAAAWRSVYSMMIGRFAAWRREWKDCSAPHNFGRWATWFGMDAESGLYQSYRSIAGRVQRLTAKKDAGDSVPLLFACVTAQARYIVRRLAQVASYENVLAIEADALWLLPAGWQALQRRLSTLGVAPDSIRCKETFDRAWMTGKSIAVVEHKGERYLRCPGVPADVAVGVQDDVRWPQSAEWHAEGGPSQKRGVRRLERRYSVKDIIRLHSGPATALPFSEELIDPMLPEHLLQPVEGVLKSGEE